MFKFVELFVDNICESLQLLPANYYIPQRITEVGCISCKCQIPKLNTHQTDTDPTPLIRNDSSARFSLDLSGNLN